MKQGDYVRLKRRPDFRGVVFETWQSDGGANRGTVLWENGQVSPVNAERDILPGEPFDTPALRRAFAEKLKRDSELLEKLESRRAWVKRMSKTKAR